MGGFSRRGSLCLSFRLVSQRRNVGAISLVIACLQRSPRLLSSSRPTRRQAHSSSPRSPCGSDARWSAAGTSVRPVRRRQQMPCFAMVLQSCSRPPTCSACLWSFAAGCRLEPDVFAEAHRRRVPLPAARRMGRRQQAVVRTSQRSAPSGALSKNSTRSPTTHTVSSSPAPACSQLAEGKQAVRHQSATAIQVGHHFASLLAQ